MIFHFFASKSAILLPVVYLQLRIDKKYVKMYLLICGMTGGKEAHVFLKKFQLPINIFIIIIES